MSMEQRSDYNGCSRKNSTYQHQSSTREQVVCRDYRKNNDKHRNSLDYSQRRSTPPSGIKQSSSVFLDQQTKKMVGDRNELQGKMLNLQRELYLQRKMNAKFRKIINSKVQKEKELETAYRGIVIELRKQMSANPNGLCKSNYKSQKEQISKCEQAQMQLKLSIDRLKQEKNKLYQEIQQLRIIEQNLRVTLKNFQKEEKTLGNAEQLSIMNKFYENQIERLHQDNYQLRQQIDQKRAQETQSKCFKNSIGGVNQKISQKDNNYQKLQINKSSFRMSHQQSEKDKKIQIQKAFNLIEVNQKQNEKIETNPQEMKKNKRSQQEIKSLMQKKQKQQPSENLFSSFQKQMSQKQQNKQEKNKLNKKKNIQQDRKLQENIINKKLTQLKSQQLSQPDSFQTAKQLERDSFVSVYSKKSDTWEKPNISQIIDYQNQKLNSEQFKSFQVQPNFQEFSNISLLNTSKKSFIHQFQNELQDILKQSNVLQKQDNNDKLVIEQLNAHVNKLQKLQKITIQQFNDKIKKDRQIFFNFFEPIRIFFSKFSLILNQYGQRYNIQFQVPEISSIASVLTAQRSLIQILPQSSIFLSRSDSFLQSFIFNFEKMIQYNRKQIDKRQNNLTLQIYDLKEQLKKSNQDSDILVKRIEKISQFNKQLQYQISELSSSSFLPSNQDKQINNFVKSVFKRKVSLPISTLIDKDIQCNLIDFYEYQNLRESILQIPLLIKVVIQKQLSREIQISQLSLNQELLPQITKILEKVISSIETKKSSLFEIQLKDRKKSCSIKDIQLPVRKQQSEEEEISVESYYQMEAEYKQMEKILKEKSSLIQKLKQRIALQKLDIEKFEQLSKRAFSKYRPQSFVLNKIEFTPPKIQRKQTRSEKIMEVQQDETIEFKQNSELKEFNNVIQGRDEELRELRQKVQSLQQAAKKIKPENSKKKKVIYLNH